MVAELYGTCNGQEMRLNRISGKGNESTWQVSIPHISDNYTVEVWAVDHAGNKSYYATTKIRPDGIVTVLKITSVNLKPNPVRINNTCEIEVVIEQEHYQYVPYSAFEFEFSNESLTDDLLDMAEYVIERTYDAQDTELKFVWCQISENDFVNLTYSSASNSWKGTLKAPAVTSWYEEDHKYPLVIEAEDEEENKVRADRYDGVVGENLQLRVLDDTAPTITVFSPTLSSYITSAYPWVVFDIFDVSPGVDFDTLTLLIDGNVVESRSAIKEDPANAGLYHVTITSLQTIKNGTHSIQVRVSDFDGNEARTSLIPFILDTSAGNGETFNISPMTFEWYRFHELVLSCEKVWTEFDPEWLFGWMKSKPEESDHFFTRTDHHEDDDIVYKLQVEVKR